jgi:hypothetical protein
LLFCGLPDIVYCTHQRKFTEFSVSRTCSQGNAQRALNRREDPLRHGALPVEMVVNPGVVCVIAGLVNAVLDQRWDAGLPLILTLPARECRATARTGAVALGRCPFRCCRKQDTTWMGTGDGFVRIFSNSFVRPDTSFGEAGDFGRHNSNSSASLPLLSRGRDSMRIRMKNLECEVRYGVTKVDL